MKTHNSTIFILDFFKALWAAEMAVTFKRHIVLSSCFLRDISDIIQVTAFDIGDTSLKKFKI